MMNSEFVSIWMALTGQTQALADAYFHLADVNDDKRIDARDYPIIYQLFDLDRKFVFYIPLTLRNNYVLVYYRACSALILYYR